MATINDINNEIDRIEAAKKAIENAVEERGIEVPAGSLLGDIPHLIRQIPGPVQADWNEADPYAPDFIKNKPTIPTVPQISTDVEADRLVTDKTVCPKAVYDSVHPQLQSSQPSGGLLPNVLYNLGTLSGFNSISFADPVDVNVENEYKFTFNTSSEPPTIIWPNTIIGWAGNCLDSNNQPYINGGKHYEISVVGGYAIIVEI